MGDSLNTGVGIWGCYVKTYLLYVGYRVHRSVVVFGEPENYFQINGTVGLGWSWGTSASGISWFQKSKRSFLPGTGSHGAVITAARIAQAARLGDLTATRGLLRIGILEYYYRLSNLITWPASGVWLRCGRASFLSSLSFQQQGSGLIPEKSNRINGA